MLNKFIVVILVFSTLIWSKGGVNIGALIKPTFSQGVNVYKKQFRLTPNEVEDLQKEAKAKIDSNVVRLYTAKKGKKPEGYAVLILKKIRTKSAAVLYIMDMKKTIKNIEVVAFSEPKEYKPNKTWLESFEGKTKEDNLFSGKGIPTLSGATLSSRSISDGARIAIAIVERYTP
jgi:hypothetical protein